MLSSQTTVPDRREVLKLAGLGVAAATTGALVYIGFSGGDRSTEALFSAPLTDLAGRTRSVKEWGGKTLLVNFWATWCTPCREEIPALVLVRDKWVGSGVEFVGIAIDQVDKVRHFIQSVPISYPVLIASAVGLDLIRTLGNTSGGLPFTVIVDRSEKVVFRHLGALTQKATDDALASIMRT